MLETKFSKTLERNDQNTVLYYTLLCKLIQQFVKFEIYKRECPFVKSVKRRRKRSF